MTNLTVSLLHVKAVFVKVTLPSKTIFVTSIDRPPNTNFDDFKTYIDNILLSLSRNECPLIICSDFYMDQLKINECSNNASTFYNGLNAMALMPTIYKPTRLTNSSCTLIDEIFASNLRNFVSRIFTIDISDKLPIFIICIKIVPQLTNFLLRRLLIG